MLLTEEEAKEKHCCTAKTYDTDDCIASNCMAWRWDEKSFRVFDENGGALNEQHNWKDMPQSEWKGYCGLAGKPE